jgi:ankyrin repeat protein
MSKIEDVLGKYSCVNDRENCNVIRPFSKLELYNINPSTKEKYTSVERDEKLQQHKNICNLNSSTVSKCCDKNDSRIEKLANSIPNNKYQKIKVEKTKNNKSIMKVCQSNDANACIGYRKPTAYELCKLANAKLDPSTHVATNLTPDCLTGSCNNELMPFIVNKNDTNVDYGEDMRIVQYIKDDNLESLKVYLHANNKNSNKILTYGFPGNTLLHESIYQNADKCSNYIMENSNNESLELKNKDGNTPLQVAALKKNIIIIHKLLLLGADIHSTNNYNETPLHSAIRSGSKDIIRVLLMNGSSIHELNKLGQSPLHIAVLTPKKDLDVIKLLVMNGSDILTLDKKNRNMLQNLSTQEDNSINNQINTYLTNSCFNKYEKEPETYKQILVKYPHFSPYEINEEANEDDDETNDVKFTKDDINGIEVEYNDQLNDKELYHDKSQLPRKLLPRNIKKYVEHFESNVSQTDNIKTKLYLLSVLFSIMVVFIIYNNAT